MPTPEYRVESVAVLAENRLRVRTEVAGDAALSVEHGDALNPSSWLVTGAQAPLVARVDVAQGGTERVCQIDLDAPLVPGAAYAVALQPWARSKYGQATKTDAVSFVAPALLAADGVAADAPGADIAFPPVADGRGDLVRIGRVDALRARVLLFVSTTVGSFGFASMATFGRGVEPKRTYGPAQLLKKTFEIKAGLLLDPDVKDASVSTRELAGAVVFDIEISPAFGGPTVAIQTTITAGEVA